MATERLSMQKTREILRQKWELGRTHREVATSVALSLGAVAVTVTRATEAGLDSATAHALSDDELEERVMTKYSGGDFYVFAIPHQLGAQTVTFTFADPSASTASVLNEDRTLPIVNRQLKDSFADEDTVHIYKIN